MSLCGPMCLEDMNTHLKKRRKKQPGLSPGTLVHTGEQKISQARLTLAAYNESHLETQSIDFLTDCAPFRDKFNVVWVNIDGLHQVEVLENLGQVFGLHALVLEDILDINQRPKVEDYSDYLYLVLKTLHYDETAHQVLTEQVSLIVGNNLVISVQEKAGDIFEPVRRRLQRNNSRLRRDGADYLAYALLDTIVDNYFVVLDKVGENIERLEEELIADSSPHTLSAIYNLKREIIFLHKAVWPLREVINRLAHGESPLFAEGSLIYLRDLYDHTIQTIDLIETYRELIAGMLDIYLSSASNRLNGVMKVLTIIATIFIPLNFITSLYGMNLKNMPEYQWEWSYPAIWLVMMTVTALMLAYFRRKRWL
jgi:magnesium transporter